MVVLTVRPLKVGAADVLISWIVLIAPLVEVKFVALKLAIPLALVLALSIVTLEPAPLELLSTSAPVRPFNDVTPLPDNAQVEQLMFPFASIAIGPLALTATVPDAFGRVIVLFDVAGAANTREFMIPLAVAVSLVEPLPWSVNACEVDPTVSAAEGVIVLTLRLDPTVRLPVKLAAAEIVWPLIAPDVVRPPNVGVAAVLIF